MKKVLALKTGIVFLMRWKEDGSINIVIAVSIY